MYQNGKCWIYVVIDKSSLNPGNTLGDWINKVWNPSWFLRCVCFQRRVLKCHTDLKQKQRNLRQFYLDMFLSLWFPPLPFPPFPRWPWVLPIRQGQRLINLVRVKFQATTKKLPRAKWYHGHCYKQAWCITMTDLRIVQLSFLFLVIPHFLSGSSWGASGLIKQ